MLESLNDSSYLEPPKYSKDYVYRCDICDEEIFEGDSYYEIDSIAPIVWKCTLNLLL